MVFVSAQVTSQLKGLLLLLTDNAAAGAQRMGSQKGKKGGRNHDDDIGMDVEYVAGRGRKT